MAVPGVIERPVLVETVRFRLTLPRYFNPLVVFLAVWVAVFLLYSWRISDALIFTAEQALGPVAFIVGTYMVPALVIALLARVVGAPDHVRELDLHRLKRRLVALLAFWAAVNVVQIGVEGGLPIVWLVLGRASMSYSEFGIPSVNGMAFALGLAIAMIAYLISELSGDRKWLLVVLLMIGWGVASISRKFFVVTLIQTGILYLTIHRVSLSGALKVAFGVLVAIVLFGVVGDLRSGRELILKYSYLNVPYPDWMPSGFVWAYMYLTTPINNIVNIVSHIPPEWNYSMSRTFGRLLPSVIRDVDISSVGQYWLVSDTFNVSTAYASPYIEVGAVGAILFSMIIALLTAGFYFFSGSTAGKMMFVVFIQALALTVFSDNFTNLNNCFQIFFIYLAFRGIERPASAVVMARQG